RTTPLVVLGDLRVVTPTDEEVPARKRLCISLADRDDRWVMDDRADEARGLPSEIEVHVDHARLPVHLRIGAVVEDPGRLVVEVARVVLPREVRAWPERKGAALAAEPPEDLARRAVELVDGVRVSRGDEQIVVAVDVDRVHVEEVE